MSARMGQVVSIPTALSQWRGVALGMQHAAAPAVMRSNCAVSHLITLVPIPAVSSVSCQRESNILPHHALGGPQQAAAVAGDGANHCLRRYASAPTISNRGF